MNVTTFLERLKHDPHYHGQIVARRVLPEREAVYRAPATPLAPALRRLLAQQEIEALYTHQADALDAVAAGRNIVICTATASGKSLCYHLPVLQTLLNDLDARALYVFPAKALAYDQLQNLERMIAAAELGDRAKPACYDGDVPTHRRPGIRRSANILLTNPDMLHQGVLPYHTKWATFFGQLRYVVLDEIHTYRGIFGAHVANVVRRLRRICRHYGADPQFICCSATLGNPQALAENLIGRDVQLIDQDGAPRGRRVVALWNPPFIEDATHVSRRSGNAEAHELMQRLITAGAGTITFTKARVVAELIYRYVCDGLRRSDRPDLTHKLKPYRGGYLPSERREIEHQLFTGELLGVCSTTALELGIDVGSLDAAIIVGFPGTLCSLWQQAGRAGRRQDESLVFFIAYDDPIDQYLMRHPDFIFDQPLEHAICDPQNPHILASQLGCAANELPLAVADLTEFGLRAADVTEVLKEDGKLRLTQDKFYWAKPDFPAAETNLRTISNATFAIIDTTGDRNEVIGQVDSISAPELVYPEAVYLHQGDSFLVRKLDQPARTAFVERLDADYYTQPVLADDCRITREERAGDVLAGRKFFGDVTVQWQTIAFRKFKLYSQELIGQTALDLPAQQIDTTGAWFQPPERAREAATAAGFKVFEALSGTRNLLMVALPPLAMCDRYDIGGVVDSSQLGTSTIIVYDRYAGGVGYARHAYEAADELLALALRIVAECDCEDGCPACVAPPNLRIPIHHDPDVGQGYAIPNKHAVLALLRAWVQP